MPRPPKKLDYNEVSDMVAVLGAISTQTKKEPFTKPEVVEATGITTGQVTAAYKRLLKMGLAEQIDPPAGMPLKGVYIKLVPKGKAYCKAFDLLFG